ncbi:hypothetical protein [Salinicola rhizosphaerae]|uniref:Uncharacterized protein n=1 Tax=Salinicola rhizosphaerae TaxID=1443141 RepID=A0ABQ3E4F6_9GAMM|nr:hypothetical protein [Salinicola rhizosphaerae]GHB23008.1 hypothetical protein GCM10009038_22540 [Salinicola rhizosphaerae]
MGQWLTSNSAAISAVTAICTLFVWLFYAQLLYLNFKRQRQPKIIINRGAGRGLDSRCVISNMSPEPIFIEHLIVVIDSDKGAISQDLIDLEQGNHRDTGEGFSNLEEVTRQGPMLSGSYSHIGTFSDILDRVLRYHQLSAGQVQVSDDRTLRSLELRIIAIYGSEDKPVGASRSFEISASDSEIVLTPKSIDTRRYASRLKRLKVRRWIRELDVSG